MITPQMSALVNKIIKVHGSVLDLKKNPEVLVEVLRGLGVQLDKVAQSDGGVPCAGVPPPPPPPPPPGPGGLGARVTNEDILQSLLKLSRDLGDVKKTLSRIKL